MVQTVELAESVEVLFASIAELADIERNPLEQASLGQDAVHKRRMEFHAGRALAREAMRRVQVTPVPIPIGKKRLPEWPDGVRASISHTSSHVAVAIAKSRHVGVVGLDIEALDAVDPDLKSHILSKTELINSSEQSRSLIERFSAKEAAYKACYPAHYEYFDMPDVTVEFNGDAFRCNPVAQLASNTVLRDGVGRIHYIDGHIISLFYAETF